MDLIHKLLSVYKLVWHTAKYFGANKTTQHIPLNTDANTSVQCKKKRVVSEVKLDNRANFIFYACECRVLEVISWNWVTFPGFHLFLFKFEYEKHIQVRDHHFNDIWQSFDLLDFRKKIPLNISSFYANPSNIASWSRVPVLVETEWCGIFSVILVKFPWIYWIIKQPYWNIQIWVFS